MDPWRGLLMEKDRNGVAFSSFDGDVFSDVGVNCLPWCQEAVSQFCRSMFYSFYNIACYLFFPLLWRRWHVAGGAARRAGARFSRILKMTAWGMDFCHGLGLLVQVSWSACSTPFTTMHITSPFPPTMAEVNAAGDVRCLVLVRRRTVSGLIFTISFLFKNLFV